MSPNFLYLNKQMFTEIVLVTFYQMICFVLERDRVQRIQDLRIASELDGQLGDQPVAERSETALPVEPGIGEGENRPRGR